MPYRTPADTREEYIAFPRRALIITTVIFETHAVNAHLTKREILIGENGATYELGFFSDPNGEWLVVHALTAQGNSAASRVTSKAHQEFGPFNVVMFVGVAGSLKEDIGIGSVVIGDYVYNAQSAKIEDLATLPRSHSIPAAYELLSAAQRLIAMEEWTNLILPPSSMHLPKIEDYPEGCIYPPKAFIKPIASGEEVVAGKNSSRAIWLRSQLNDAAAVEMEGWGVMEAAHSERASAIIVRGISDMCAGKDYAKDVLFQPIAAVHAAAFAFSILSFRSKVPEPKPLLVANVTKNHTSELSPNEDQQVEFVFNFDGSRDEWSPEKIESLVKLLNKEMGENIFTLVRIETGSVRLVFKGRKKDLEAIDLLKLKKTTAANGVILLGIAPLELVGVADEAMKALAVASADLLSWEKTLPNGRWMERTEQEIIEKNFKLDNSSTVLLGEPGSGKSSLLSKIASDLLHYGIPVFALKADFLSMKVRTETDLQRDLHLPASPSDLILHLAKLRPVYVLIDQLDAIASQLDLKSGRLNVLLNMIRRIGNTPNIHVLLSARTFEFNHDVRLRAIEAEAVTLSLPPWHDVKINLSEIGINPEVWPEKAKEVVRIPQALKTFLDLVNTGKADPYNTYQAMLEQLWNDRIALADDNERLISLASDLASKMAEDEVLWLAASRFDEHSLIRLEALGFIVRSENKLRVAFSHQTIFDYVLARTFIRNEGLLSAYILERQESLFVRPKLWSALNYLREAEVTSYEREFNEIWNTKRLRRHLRFLLVEFLGQVFQPLEFEKIHMAEVLKSQELRILGLKAICSSSGWFPHFFSTAIKEAMMGSIPEMNQALQILILNWKTDGERVIRLIKECWVPYPENDNYSWSAIAECPHWTDEIEEIAETVLRRSSIVVWHIVHTAMALAVEQPEAAIRMIKAKFDYLLSEARSKPEQQPLPIDGKEEEKVSLENIYGKANKLWELFNSIEWSELPSLAEADPAAYLQCLWPWYIDIFAEILNQEKYENVKHIYPGRYILEKIYGSRTESREKPIINALETAIEELAKKAPEDFLKWSEENSNIEMMVVQQLIANGYKVAANKLASKALDWLLIDKRRFQLGRRMTNELIISCVVYWNADEIKRLQDEVCSYNPQVKDYIKEPKQRRYYVNIIRAIKKDLLLSIGIERLSPHNIKFVATEQRALGNRFDDSLGEITGGFIGSPMESTAMAKAIDHDILKIFREIPDNTEWNHPTHWMRGGNIQLSRAFADFARSDPKRTIRLLEKFEPRKQERAAGYALNAMAEDESNNLIVFEAFRYLNTHGFQGEEFRDSAANAIEKIANRGTDISEEIIDILIKWLSITPPSPEKEVEIDENALSIGSKDEDFRERSILWSGSTTFVLPHGNYNILSALATILLEKKEAGRDRYIEILNEHLLREHNPNIWKALLIKLGSAGGSTPQGVSTFFRKLFMRFPKILSTREAIFFLAYAHRWDDQLVFDLISDWQKSDRMFLQRAYGELVGLVAAVRTNDKWLRSRDEIITSGTEDTKIGLAYAAMNSWSDGKLRPSASVILVAMLKGASKRLVATMMDIFRLIDELIPDEPTVELLHAFINPATDISASSSSFVVECLQTLLPHEAELVAAFAKKLVDAWHDKLGNFQTEFAFAAPQLTDLALTLHRLGGASRQSGVTLFEEMIEIDAYGARATLYELDGRFGYHQAVARRRIPRRKKPRSRH